MIFNSKDYSEYQKIIKIREISKIIILLFVISIALNLFIVFNYWDLNISMDETTKEELYEIDKNYSLQCGNLSFQETAICLNEFAKNNFKYKVTEDSKDLTIKDLINIGGDCKDFSEFYVKYMNYYGYTNNKVVSVPIREDSLNSYWHEFVIAGDVSGYCTLDVEYLTCYKYVDDNGEIEE